MSQSHQWERWDNYVGRSIRNTKDYLHRSMFVDFVLEIGASSILEIGPGQLLEYQRLKEKKEDLDYSIVEVSKCFLNNCSVQFPEIKQYQCSMHNMDNLGFRDGQFDMVYGSSVLEHSPDVTKTIEESIRVSRYFQFVLFKWRYGGGLEGSYHEDKAYWSSFHNLVEMLELMEKQAEIISKVIVINKDRKVLDYDEYAKTLSGEDKHRNKNYLIITGKRKRK